MRSFVVACALMVALPTVTLAKPLPEPTDRVILTISGAIAESNGAAGAQFDRAMFEALPQTTIRTLTPWTEGEAEFRGVRLAELLATVGASGERVVARALNDYQEEIPLSDLSKHEIVVAIRMNGDYMRVRDKGPLWIVYDLDTADSTVAEAARMVWQLSHLDVR